MEEKVEITDVKYIRLNINKMPKYRINELILPEISKIIMENKTKEIRIILEK